jgi:hypothetical protein
VEIPAYHAIQAMEKEAAQIEIWQIYSISRCQRASGAVPSSTAAIRHTEGI